MGNWTDAVEDGVVAKNATLCFLTPENNLWENLHFVRTAKTKTATASSAPTGFRPSEDRVAC
jgi:hypothetical protein